jgi:hypothetical protein
MENRMDEETQIEKMILDGALEISGIDEETGEFLYTFTDKLAEQYPELYKETQTYFSKEMMFLWENSFISMDVTDSNPLVSLTEKALDKEEVSKLSPEVQAMLKEVIRVLFIDE